MPVIESPDQATLEALKMMENQFDRLDQVVDRSHPKFREYATLRTKAQTTFSLMQMCFDMNSGKATNGFETFQQKAEELQKLYEECVKIRGEMVFGTLSTVLGVRRGSSIDNDLQRELESTFGPFASEEMKSIQDSLQEISANLAKNPADILNGSDADRGAIGYYIIDQRGMIIPAFHELDKDLERLHSAETAFSRVRDSGGQGRHVQMILCFIGKLRAGLEHIRSIDPQAKEIRDWQKGLEIKHDWKPLRLALAVSGGVFSLMGIGFAIAGKGFSPATGLWMAVAVLAARPDLVQGGDTKALESIKALDHRAIHKFLTQKDWSGGKGVKAFRELQEARTSQAELFETLSKSSSVEPGMRINELVGEKSEAGKLLNSSKMSDSERAEAIKLFGKDYDDGQKEMIETALMWGNYSMMKSGAGGTP